MNKSKATSLTRKRFNLKNGLALNKITFHSRVCALFSCSIWDLPLCGFDLFLTFFLFVAFYSFGLQIRLFSLFFSSFSLLVLSKDSKDCFVRWTNWWTPWHLLTVLHCLYVFKSKLVVLKFNPFIIPSVYYHKWWQMHLMVQMKLAWLKLPV